TSDTITVNLSVLDGTLTLGTTSGLTVTGSTAGSSLSFTGSLSNVDSALNTISYRPNAEFEGTDTLSFSATTSDAVTGLPTSTATSSTSLTIHVDPVAETPTLTASMSATGFVNENQPATLLTAFGGSLSVSIDAADATDTSDTITENWRVVNDTRTLGTTSGLTVGSTTGSSLSFTGSLSNVDSALNTISYRPNAEFEGTDTLSFSATTSDAVTGLPTSTATSSTSLTIHVDPVAETPTLTASMSATGFVNENQPATLLTAFGGSLSVSIDAADATDTSDTITENWRVVNDTRTLGTTSGLTVGSTTGSSLSFTGSLSNVDSALNTISYRPNAEFEGTDTLSFSATTSDAVTGLPTSTATSSTSLTIHVDPVAETPTLTASMSATGFVNENQPATLLTAFGGSLSVSIDAADATDTSDTITVNLSVLDGTLTLGTTSGLTVGSTTGSSLSLPGSLSNVDSALNTISYRPNAEFEGTDTLSFSATTSDAVTGLPTSTATRSPRLSIHVDPVAETPTLTASMSATGF